MRVVRLKPYIRAMKRMGLAEEAMREVEARILRDPLAHPVVQGLGGVRKMRVARPGGEKSGGGRVLYFLATGKGMLAMLTAYAKNVQEDLTPADRRAILRAVSTVLGEGE